MFRRLAHLSRYSYQPAIHFTKGNSANAVAAPQVAKETYQPKVMTVRDALNMALDEELKRDPAVILLGEEVGQYQGAYKVSKGLLEKHGPAKVIDTPITEAGFAGLGVGAGLVGLKPIIEFMTFNFAMQAIDHILNSCAKARYMSGGDLSCQVVFRGINGAAASVGAQHSQCFAAWYSQVPGLVVMAPFDCDDAKSMLKAAIRDPNPVVFLENEILYNGQFEMSGEAMDPEYVAPIGKAKIMREGSDVTIVAFSKMVQYSLDAAKEMEKEGVSCEVINLRTLRPLDRETIIGSVKKTGRLVAVEEGWPQCGITAEICALMMETSTFYYLDAPVQRVTGADIPTPYAFNLEPMSFPQAFNISSAVRKVLGRE